MNIVQISSVVSGTATSGSLGFDATTSPVSFSAPTVAGNFILACCWVTGATTGSPLSTIAPASINPTGQALTFSYFALGENWDNPTSGSLANGSGGFFYLRNAPSILTSTTFTFTGQMSGGGGSGTYTMNVEFFLVEVSGISPTASYNAYARLYSNSGGTVNPGALSTSATTAVFVIFSGQGINIAAGTGYALLGSPASVAVTGQVQYRLGVASGSVPTAFTGTEPYWAALALAFAASAGVAPTITSPASATFTAGTNQAFTVTTTGTPTAGLTSVGTLPTGVTFTDNLDGTATLGGLVDLGATGIYSLAFTAANGINPNAVQNFTLTVVQSAGSLGSTSSGLGVGGAQSPNVPAVFTYRQLGPNSDPIWTSYYSNVYAVAQAILTRIRLFQGEWWESTLDGTPMFQRMLGAPGSSTQQVSLLLQQRILDTPYVTGVSNLEVNFDSPSRAFSMSCTAQTAFGPTTISYAPQPPAQGIP